MTIFVTSDTHFNHANVIRYCARPFANYFEMNKEMIHNWNLVVSPEDTVIHLGDVLLTQHRNLPEIISKLNGRKIAVAGNHDRLKNLLPVFDKVYEKTVDTAINGIRVRFSHYPCLDTSEFDLNICGHVHEHWLWKDKCLNVGVDVWEFTPVSLQDVLYCFEILKTLKFWPETISQMRKMLYGQEYMGFKGERVLCLKKSLEKFSNGSGMFEEREKRIL